MEKKKVYISGKITGLDYNYAYDRFAVAEAVIKEELKYEVVNPMKAVPLDEKKTWEDYMLKDIELLFNCDMIYMLDNWHESKGARIECAIAKNMDKAILFESTFNEL